MAKKKTRAVRDDATVATVEKEFGLEEGTIRNPDGTNSRGDKLISTLRRDFADEFANLPEHINTADEKPELYYQIQDVLEQYPDLLWPSEDDDTPEVFCEQLSVEIPKRNIKGDYQLLPAGDETLLLTEFFVFNEERGNQYEKGAQKLHDLLQAQNILMGYKSKEADADGRYTLIIGVPLEAGVTGIRVFTVET